jgi:hypothetical protein
MMTLPFHHAGVSGICKFNGLYPILLPSFLLLLLLLFVSTGDTLGQPHEGEGVQDDKRGQEKAHKIEKVHFHRGA